MTTKKFLIIVVICLIGAGVFQIRSCHNYYNARNALMRQIDTYVVTKGEEAALLALELTKPYLTIEDYAVYDHRITMVQEHHRTHDGTILNLLDIPDDSYGKILASFAFEEFKAWARRKLIEDLGDWAANDHAKVDELVLTTPSKLVVDLHQGHQFANMVSMRFYADDFNDMEDVEKAREDFLDEMAKLDAALKAAKAKCDEMRATIGAAEEPMVAPKSAVKEGD